MKMSQNNSGLETHKYNNRDRRKLQKIGCELISLFMKETNPEEQQQYLAEVMVIEELLKR